LGARRSAEKKPPLVPGEQSKQLLAQISNSLSPEVTCHVRHSHVTTRRTQTQLMQGGSPCASLGERVLPALGMDGELGRCRAFRGGVHAHGAFGEGLGIKMARSPGAFLVRAWFWAAAQLQL